MADSSDNAPAINAFGQPVGFALPDWAPPPFPPHKTLMGRYCHLEPLNAGRHAQELWTAQSDDPKGVAAYLRIVPSHGVIEIGHIYYSSQLAKTRAATEAMYLLADNAFKLGYRRYEWKCDSFNQPSRNAAARLGFTYEGTFRQPIVYKGRNRDTSWLSIIDVDWNRGLKSSFERWLEPSNFDGYGQQKLKLSELTAPFVHATS
ncbi:hypothetical protein PC116_g3574 [Phytophthora cactorum]|uniref:N-acetyltransferase domain-containing protein n=1 Tax=Phytophthora cactorum TaxID=29920 RepID=A0A8T0Y1S2_9STRA|nr:hypothetical protein PC111_g20167 [Phytophthora cactorum]KAG2821713.1 hypothetical protein PC113_g22434 [Phytophthora cactorum]KAG2880487.1 hypothetical protein PC114_g22060 [Phytophthora cactorum]KAG2927012.1 hypothetical protein PC115_g7715 [Phytophthora cactorum]KAG2953800.1 hypothetical protein PC117_g1703 [Phytophthora cactorum]